MRRLLVATTFTLLGCATQPAPPPAPATQAKPAAAPAPLVTPATVAWDDMKPEQKGKYMKEVVVPKMHPLFAAFEPDEFKDSFKCSVCHGKDPKSVKFKMPSPDLPELPATREGFMELAEKKPKMMAFMKEQVLPQMAALLGKKMFDPSKPQEGGFGCMGCHTMKKTP